MVMEKNNAFTNCNKQFALRFVVVIETSLFSQFITCILDCTFVISGSKSYLTQIQHRAYDILILDGFGRFRKSDIYGEKEEQPKKSSVKTAEPAGGRGLILLSV